MVGWRGQRVWHVKRRHAAAAAVAGATVRQRPWRAWGRLLLLALRLAAADGGQQCGCGRWGPADPRAPCGAEAPALGQTAGGVVRCRGQRWGCTSPPSSPEVVSTCTEVQRKAGEAPTRRRGARARRAEPAGLREPCTGAALALALGRRAGGAARCRGQRQGRAPPLWVVSPEVRNRAGGPPARCRGGRARRVVARWW